MNIKKIKKPLVIGFTILLVTFLMFFRTCKYYNSKHWHKTASAISQDLIDKGEIKEGDIVFQTTRSRQKKAIQLSTHLEYDHCGLVFKKDNEFYVFEAVKKVKMTPLNEWITRGVDNHFVIKRLENATEVLTTEKLDLMKLISKNYEGKKYDILFEWSDDKMYCSEVVWKIYKQATGIEVGKLKKFRDFDLNDEEVKNTITERYGNEFPFDETVISPADIYNSDLLYCVITN